MVKARTHTVAQASALVQTGGLLAMEHFDGSVVPQVLSKILDVYRNGQNMGTFMKRGSYGLDVPVHQIKRGKLRLVYWWDTDRGEPKWVELVYRKDAYQNA